jgi:anthranilate phosphoribosyltransferase
MFKPFIQKVAAGETLNLAEARQAMEAIMSGEAPPVQIGAFATALRMRGETVEELAGFVSVMRERVLAITVGDTHAIDTCGTGGDGAGTFNISTAAALIAAGAGVTVVKHGGRGVSSGCGSADVLAELGVNLEASPEAVERCVHKAGIGFCFAPVFHPAMKAAAPVRRELGIRTFFNLLGPLSNPAGVKRQVLGVFHPDWAGKMAAVLKQLGSEHIFAFSNDGGLDELSFAHGSSVAELKDGKIKEYRLDSSGWSYAAADSNDLAGGDAKTNAKIILGILEGEKGPRRDAAVLNAAAAVYIGGKSGSVREGLAFSEEAIDSGRAREKLGRLIKESHKT